MVAGDWQPYIPAATVGPPALADGVVPRPAVVQRLSGARGGDLVVVTAPAGCGKTTAALLWSATEDRPFAWARIDHLDDDPVHLLLHIAVAVDQACGLDPDVLRYLRGPGRTARTDLLPAVIRALESCPPLVVVLDDMSQLTAAESVEVLCAFIDLLPAAITMAVLSRSAPPLDLGRRRLQGRVIELGNAELRFTDAEAAAAFEAVSGMDHRPAAAVIDQCEGWPAGVTLAALALRDGARVDTFTGRNRLVADYLVEEVLDRLDDESTTFLLESAVLDRFCADQLDAVLGRTDSQRIIERLVKSGNLFLISLDGERIWYRYHRLFGDLLRSRLRADAPARFREIATAASDLLARSGDVDGAIVLALRAGDRARAAALVGAEAVKLGFDGRAGVLARRLDLLDERTIAEFPDAAIANAWLGVTTGNAEMIQRSLLLAHRADRGQRLSDGTPSVPVAAALVGSLVGVGGVQEVLRHADVVRAAGGHLVNPWWGAATVMKGAALSMVGANSRARVLLEAALPVVGDLPGFRAAALAHLALLDLAAGDDAGCIARSAAAQTIVDTNDLCDVVPMIVVYAVSAVTAARTGNAEAAYVAVGHAERLMDRLGELAARTALLGHGLLAWTAAVLEDAPLLARHLDAAERSRAREPDASALSKRVDRVRALAAAEARRPLTPAELRLLPHLATHLSLQQIAAELQVGRETAKSQATAIYRKLGVTSRSAAVAEAKAIGLLTD